MENIVTINAYGYETLINVTRGANCIALRNSEYNANILREPDYSRELDNPYLYGMPVLYPVNRISGGSFWFEGRKYGFPINEPATECHLHGEVHNAVFSVTDQGKDFVICSYESCETKEFPHAFKMDITYALSQDGLLQKTEIFNLSHKNMPNFLGYHTTFNIPFVKASSADNITVKADVGIEIERGKKNYLPTGNILPEDDITRKIKNGEFKPFEKIISRHYRACGDGVIEIYDNAQGLKIVYENDSKFGWRLFYNGNADQYICLEPMTCMANCQNSPFDRAFSGFDFIEPNSSKEYISKIGLRELEK